MKSVTDPDTLQRTAASPDASAWVAASAGSGKTKVLSDRVLNLMLEGCPPEKILCLTFTRTAAAEMANRLTEILAKWATAAEPDLKADLEKLTGTPADTETENKARRLFAKMLDAPGGINIMTIHGFCQSLLKRFPLESGVSPQFDVLDEQGASDLIEHAQEDVLSRAEFADALDLIALLTNEDGFSEMLKEMTFCLKRLEELEQSLPSPEALTSGYERMLNLPAGATEQSLKSDFCRLSLERENQLKQAALILGKGKGSKDRKNAEKIAEFLAADEEKREELLDDYLRVFLLKDSAEIRKELTHKGTEDALDFMTAEADRASGLYDRLKSAVIMQASLAAVRIGLAVMKRYGDLKNERCAVDYDDLIAATGRLLSRSHAAAWVLFKLDGGIDHILVDEAQDTSPASWAIVRSLAEEFFAGKTAREQNRTLFVVGDKKQSIYSFQQADPYEFEKMRAFFKQKATDAGKIWNDVPMYISFRSTPAVIELVNRVLKKPEAAEGVLNEGEDGTHLSWRTGQAGLVEIWPPEKSEENDTAQVYTKPVEQIVIEKSSTRLAKKIAAKIASMINGGEMLPSLNRPVRAGDILILVRRRNAFIEELSRELKALNIPVSGVDRLKITTHIAVKDLMVLGDFLLLPEDDLALATVLRSPLCNVSEEDLFTLAYDRKGKTLLTRLARHKNEGETALGKAYAFLSDLLNRADKMRPFELYSYVLGACGGKKAFLGRLGYQAADALDEFMSLALNRDESDVPSLQNFLKYLRGNEIEIKRDPDRKNFDAVRMMTVHASKGLQAPVVFLPDTRGFTKHPPKLLWPKNEDLPLWAPKKETRNNTAEERIKEENRLEAEEYNRLLYVALTRAADRLYLCGWNAKNNRAPKGNWYDLVKDALVLEETDGQKVYAATEIDDPMFDEPVLRIESAQTAEPKNGETPPEQPEASPVPECLTRPAPEEPTPPKPLAPSRPDIEEPSFLSPLGKGRAKALKRGEIIHTLLETLPALPPAEIRNAAERLIKRKMPDADAAEREKIIDSVTAVLEHDEFKFLFSTNSLAEVPVSGLVKNRIVSGRIDRLAVTDGEVLFADYKSNRIVPQSAEETPAAYVAQARAYADALKEIYPDKKIRAFLIWTEEAVLSEISSLVV